MRAAGDGTMGAPDNREYDQDRKGDISHDQSLVSPPKRHSVRMEYASYFPILLMAEISFIVLGLLFEYLKKFIY